MKISMKTFLVGLVVGTASMGHAKSTDVTRIKEQTEAGFNLSDRAAEQILHTYKFDPEERTDYYADIYDGHQFLLIPSPEMYKFRLKAYRKKWILQANTKLSIDIGACSNGVTFKMKRKRVGELIMDKHQKEQFADGIVNVLDQINADDLSQGAKEIMKFHQFIMSLDVPLLSTLTSVPPTKNWYFTASHLTHKIKWLLYQDMGYGKVQISIAHGEDYVGSTFIQQKYEIEFQIEDPMSLDQFSQSICRFMDAQHLGLEDFHPPRAKAQLETLRRLAKFNEILNLPAAAAGESASAASLY